MTEIIGGKPQHGVPGRRSGTLSRRAALLAPLVLGGCETIEGWFTTKKDPLPGKREPLGTVRRGFRSGRERS